MTSKRVPVYVIFVVVWLLGAPLPAGAGETASSTLGFGNLSITAPPGTFSLDGSWTLDTFAHADNSLGQFDDHGNSSISPDAIGAAAAVTWASATGAASALGNPPDLVVAGSATSDVNIPSLPASAAFSNGRGTLFNTFTLAGTGSIAVQFSIDISGLLNVTTDPFGAFARTETIFHFDIDGTPVLFSDDILFIGPNDAKSLSFSRTLTSGIAPLMLEAGVSHFVILEADSESSAASIPEPSTGLLLIAGLAALGAARRRTSRVSAA